MTIICPRTERVGRDIYACVKPMSQIIQPGKPSNQGMSGCFLL